MEWLLRWKNKNFIPYYKIAWYRYIEINHGNLPAEGRDERGEMIDGKMIDDRWIPACRQAGMIDGYMPTPEGTHQPGQA
jgi:hypothetical protein